MDMRHLLFGIVIFTAVGCAKTLQLNLVIDDPCNQSILSDTTLQHIELTVTAPDLTDPEGTIWSRQDGEGSVLGLTPVENATVTVTGRSSNGAGDPADVIAGIGVGYVDLTGSGSDVVDLRVVFGRVDRFMNTSVVDTVSNSDVQCTSLGTARRGHTASLLPDGRVFIAGGESVKPSSTQYLETTEYFEPVTGLFVPGPSMMANDRTWTREAHTATVLNDGTILIAGGIYLNGTSKDTLKVALIYDPATATFQVTPSPGMVSPRANHTATLLGDGRVLLAGGTSGSASSSTELASTEIYDPSSQVFCAGPSSQQPRAFHSAVRVSDNMVALIGGRGAGQLLSSVQFVNVTGCGQGAAVTGQALSKARSHAVAALISGKSAIFVAGGFDAVVDNDKVENGKGINSVEVIKVNVSNPASSSLATCNLTLVTARGAASMVELPTGFLILGGLSASPPNHLDWPSQAVATAETVGFVGGGDCDVKFTATAGQLTTARAGAQATVMVGGDILVTGGFSKTVNPANGAVEEVVSLAQGEIFVRQR